MNQTSCREAQSVDNPCQFWGDFSDNPHQNLTKKRVKFFLWLKKKNRFLEETSQQDSLSDVAAAGSSVSLSTIQQRWGPSLVEATSDFSPLPTTAVFNSNSTNQMGQFSSSKGVKTKSVKKPILSPTAKPKLNLSREEKNTVVEGEREGAKEGETTKGGRDGRARMERRP